MPVITKIKVQKKNKHRYSIFTDDGKGEEYAFSVDEDVLIKYELKKGMELDDTSISEVLFQDDIRKAYNTALQYLSHRMRSEGEVREHLSKKEVSESIIQEVVHRLYHHKFLDDVEFGKAFVRTQMNTTDKGPGAVKIDLREKGIKAVVIDEVMGEYPYERQVEKAVQLGSKFIMKNSKDSSVILKQKLEQFLLRKGYPFSVIQLVMKEVSVKKETDEEMEALQYQGAKLQRKFSKLEGYEQKQKIKKGLYTKGFSIDLIDQYLSELKEEDSDNR
ncbi:regulatory protein [Mesobacillus persicus]|uniref:Regulatory protein RecX n=1 Tax=Mesobacillus persicus TaxID=930146 RepID=A0A1H8K2Q9_9BACI|nr:recombination regulator RecX [Mesobacillus persicus]SEN87319.1 regulatory protein [Mesobacillus persicus]